MTAIGHKPQSTLTRREWQEFKVEVGGLQEDQVDRLHGLSVGAARRLKLPETAVCVRTHRGLRAQQVVGILAVPGLSLEILPKIEGTDDSVRAALIRMLAVAYDLRVSEGELAALDTQRRDLLEILIRLFCERLLAAVKHGLSRRYLDREEDLPVFRGSLLVKRQLTVHAPRPDRLACRFDELSEDTPINRVLKTTVMRLSRVAKTTDNLRRLDELVARFDATSVSPRPLDEPVRLDRTNAAFHHVYRLARLFLAGDWQSTSGGKTSGFALLFPMNALFEAYVGRMMRRALVPWPVNLQDRKHYALRNLDSTGAFALRPDMVIRAPGGPIIVDTKWKRLDRANGPNHGVSQSDVYQMLAYAQAYEARQLVLLYPWDRHLSACGVIKRWNVAGSDRALMAATLDVGDTRSVLHQLRNLFQPEYATAA